MANDIVLREPEVGEHEQKGGALLEQAEHFEIQTNDDYEIAVMAKNEVAEIIKAIEMEFDGTNELPGPTKLAHRAWKAFTATRDKALKRYADTKAVWDRKIAKHQHDVEQKRLAELRKAEEAARKKAEDERRKAIQDAKRQGDIEAAQNLKEAPLQVNVAPPKTAEVPIVSGQRRSGPDWDFEIINDALIPREYLMPNDRVIRARVKSLGSKANIAGVNVFDARARG